MLRELLLISVLIASAAAVAGAAGEMPVLRENIEWCDIWIPDAAAAAPKRVLLVGDSITRGYYNEVAKKVGGKASVARLATSKCLCDPAFLAELSLVLNQYPFDVVHFNNGLHGWGYTEEQYRKSFPEVIAAIRKLAPRAKLIWATTTPVRVRDDLKTIAPNTERVKVRNAIALEFATREGIAVDDLYALVIDHPEYYGADGTHFNGQGVAAEGAQVGDAVLEALE